MQASGRFRLAADSERRGSEHPTAATRLLALARRETVRDIALTAMLILECAALFIAAPLAALDYDAAAFMIDLLVLGYALLLIVISRGRAAGWLAAVGAGCVLASATTYGMNGMQIAVWLHAAGLLGVSICCFVIAMAVLAPGLVTVHRLLGAIVLYLNTALAFGMFYRLLWEVMPAGFTGMPADAGDAQVVAATIYFSFVTLTSTGFGDIVPIHPLLRSITNVEAVIGQLYPATLIAALVTQHLDARRQRAGTSE
jgi:hypothetical protein